MGVRLGINDKFGYRSAGNWAGPTYTEITLVKDLNLDATMDEAEVTSRASGGIKQWEPTLLALGIDCEIVEDPSNAVYLALLAAFTGRTLTEFIASSGGFATAGEIRARFEGKIFGWKRVEPLAGNNVISFVCKPCYSANIPIFGVVA